MRGLLLLLLSSIASASASRSFQNSGAALPPVAAARACGRTFCVERLWDAVIERLRPSPPAPPQVAARPAPSAAGDLGAWRVFPNPIRAAEVARLTFDRLPAGARVRIFTVSGRLVADGSGDGSGRFDWDLRNGQGQPAASGFYFAVASDGGDKAVRRFAILR